MNLTEMRRNPNKVLRDVIKMALEDGVRRCDDRIAVCHETGIKLLEDEQRELKDWYKDIQKFMEEGVVNIEWVGVASGNAQARNHIPGCAEQASRPVSEAN